MVADQKELGAEFVGSEPSGRRSSIVDMVGKGHCCTADECLTLV